jgi:hypothetical protein
MNLPCLDAMAGRNATSGTVLVVKTCEAFNQLAVDTPLENVLVSMQNAIHKSSAGQTPEVVYSVHRKLIVHK